jgi:hypothetical protein
VRNIGLALPGVEESTAYGLTALKVHGKLLACVRFLRHPKDARGSVLVGVFRVGTLIALCLEFRMLGFEGVRDVFQKNETEDDMLVLSRIHVVAERICHAPELRFIDTHHAGVSRRKITNGS